MSDESKKSIDRTFVIEGAMMDLNKLTRRGGVAAVGPDLSRPSPIYRPPHPSPDEFVQSHYCDPTAEGHCVTCSDEALQARVLRVDEETGLALVEVMAEEMRTEEIDITLVENVVPGDLLLVHGGVAIANGGAD